MTQYKAPVPTIMKRLIKECSLSEESNQNWYKLNRSQLLELLLYVEELKKLLNNQPESTNGQLSGS